MAFSHEVYAQGGVHLIEGVGVCLISISLILRQSRSFAAFVVRSRERACDKSREWPGPCENQARYGSA